MKKYFSKFLKFILLQLISFTLLFGTIVFATIIWPGITPIGENSAGSFMQYFTNMTGNCPVGESLGGFNANFTKNCIPIPPVTNTATCGGSIPANSTTTNGNTYTQTWSGSTWIPIISWGENQTDCDFDCNSGYNWYGSSCGVT